jgi:hypothetical protein
MRKHLRLVALIIPMVLVASNSYAAVKAGSSCSKAGIKSVSAGKTFTCVKSGKKLVWNKGVSISVAKPAPSASATPSPAPTQSPVATEPAKVEITMENFNWTSVCQEDPWVPADWKTYQTWALKNQNFGCARPLRFYDAPLTSVTPKTELTSGNNLTNIETCKIRTENPTNSGPDIGFYGRSPINLGGKITIQIVPLQFNDFVRETSPLEDHKKYFDYLKDGFFKLSDGLMDITWSVPDKYYPTGTDLRSYFNDSTFKKGTFIYPLMDVEKYRKDLIAAVDPYIDFSKVDMVFIMVPPSVPSQYVAHGTNDFNYLSTKEKRVDALYRVPPVSMEDRSSWYGVEPFLHFHEFMHPIGKMDDHVGDEFGREGPDIGTGMWGNMSGMMMDFLVWDKWKAGIMRDSQIRCADPNKESVHWLKPSTIFGEYEKGLVIPVSKSKVIVIESMRSYGFNFKVPKKTNGALVYTVDTSVKKRAHGVNVIRPKSRTGSYDTDPFPMWDAALKNGESMTVDGYKISVVESGDFGDVIKVEKA